MDCTDLKGDDDGNGDFSVDNREEDVVDVFDGDDVCDCENNNDNSRGVSSEVPSSIDNEADDEEVEIITSFFTARGRRK